MKESQEIKKFVGRIVAGAYYDIQEVRIATKNRIRDVIRKKVEGIPFDAVEPKKEDEESNKEEKYTDKQLFELWKKLEKEDKITSEEYEYVLKCWDIAHENEKIESKYKTAMMEYISSEKVYTEFMQYIRGIGEVLSANLIKEFGDCSRYDNVAKLWAHCGQAVINGQSPKRKKGEEINYSPKLKTMVWKISDCLLKQNKAIFRNIYDTSKEASLNREYKEGELYEKYGKSVKQGKKYNVKDTHLFKGHAHARALRKMRKLFLATYWDCARELGGLGTKGTYAVDKLHHKSMIRWRDIVKAEKAAQKKKI